MMKKLYLILLILIFSIWYVYDGCYGCSSANSFCHRFDVVMPKGFAIEKFRVDKTGSLYFKFNFDANSVAIEKVFGEHLSDIYKFREINYSAKSRCNVADNHLVITGFHNFENILNSTRFDEYDDNECILDDKNRLFDMLDFKAGEYLRYIAYNSEGHGYAYYIKYSAVF